MAFATGLPYQAPSPKYEGKYIARDEVEERSRQKVQFIEANSAAHLFEAKIRSKLFSNLQLSKSSSFASFG